QSGFDRLAEVLSRDKKFLAGFYSPEDQERINKIKIENSKLAPGKAAIDTNPFSPDFGLDINQRYRKAVQAAQVRAKANLANNLPTPATFGGPGDIKNLIGTVQQHRKQLGAQGIDVNGLLSRLEQALPENVRKDQQGKVLGTAKEEVRKFFDKFLDGV